MRISIKRKLTIFIILILILNIAIVSFASLRGISAYQKKQYESDLKEDSKIANIYIREQFLKETNSNYKSFYEKNAKYLCKNLRNLINNDVALYDIKGNNLMGRYIAGNEQKKDRVQEKKMDKLMLLALENNIVYRDLDNNKIEYLAPIYDYDGQIGVIRLIYNIKSQKIFYSDIKNMYLEFGLLSIIIVFIIAKVVVINIMKKMKHLTKSLELVEEGKFEDITLIESNDEIGDLSLGIQSMALTIRNDIDGMQNEKKKLQKLIIKLRELEKKQKHFIGNITHEFKTPITVIKAQQDLIALYSDDTTMVKNAKKVIDSELQRLDDMVENILYLSSIEKYDYEFKQERVEINAIIKEIANRMQAKAQKFGITIKLKLEHAEIYFDKDSFTQIIINVIDNAIKYNKADGNIDIRSYKIADNVVIEIEDTGIGIPDEIKDKIFDPFYTVDKNRSKNHSGTGLGLPIVKTMLKKQGGSITVHSNKKGSIFIITIPVFESMQVKI
ncbi:HAMP domain-containing sensor histidine kinase [Clostridiaceae bacterium M8S5]|nr:HAMP domain-containing sensor histidine kinase [Clostridiaceae bacterium M8S5]